MAILNSNEIFFTAFEPKQANRFIMYIDGIPSYEIKGVSAITLNSGTVQLNHINVQRKVKGKSTWNNVTRANLNFGSSGTFVGSFKFLFTFAGW